jgi:hypothetical protein
VDATRAKGAQGAVHALARTSWYWIVLPVLAGPAACTQVIAQWPAGLMHMGMLKMQRASTNPAV